MHTSLLYISVIWGILTILSLYKWERWGSGKLSDLPKTIPLVADLEFIFKLVCAKDSFHYIMLTIPVCNSGAPNILNLRLLIRQSHKKDNVL